MKSRTSLALAVLLGICSLAYGQQQTLSVMSFNVRYPSPDDGENVWELRRDILVETIRVKDPDLMGTQELYYSQGEYIVENLPDYTWFGISRRGNHDDEHMGIFYKPDRLTLVQSGEFWLSETPDVPGSSSWDMSLPRMVSWGLFEFAGSGRQFILGNTHFPHREQDEAARLECAKVIFERMQDAPPGIPVILIGDFNAAAGGDVYELMLSQFTDAWQDTVHRSGPEATFNEWTGVTEGRRIDWILYQGLVRPDQVETVTHNRDGSYPSDHYPVYAEFTFE